MVQVVKEPTGHKGPRVTTEISLPGRFLVLMPNEVGVNVSKKITSAKERARLKSCDIFSKKDCKRCETVCPLRVINFDI